MKVVHCGSGRWIAGSGRISQSLEDVKLARRRKEVVNLKLHGESNGNPMPFRLRRRPLKLLNLCPNSVSRNCWRRKCELKKTERRRSYVLRED
ncbi:hypothetical protein Lal_00042190 [Lupinus albus]|nr:hypothetical protein Lal_00042190 [Lupinus albus]